MIHSQNSLLISKGITKNYEDLEVLKGIDLDIKEGEIICFLGSSGSGKSTLMNILSGLLNQSKGEIFFDGMLINSSKRIDDYRSRSISMIFQNFALIDHLTVVENLILSNWYNDPRFPTNVKKATEILNKMGLTEHMSKYPGQLSSGQKQRIGIARALMKNPRIIFADEPTGALDTQNSELIMKMLISAIREDGGDGSRCLIYSTHDLQMAQFADRILMLKNGMLTLISPEDLNEINSILELY